MISARINTATGAVLEWGAAALVAGPGETIVSIANPESFPEGHPNRYVKVVAGLFSPMTLPERAAVDRAIPQRRVQRVRHLAEVTVSTNETDAGGGWGNVIALTHAQPLIAGSYQVACGFELALVTGSALHTAQAQLQVDGAEVATWHNPRQAYNRCEYHDTVLHVTGAAPTFRLRIRRLGGGLGTARARKATIMLIPAAPILAEL